MEAILSEQAPLVACMDGFLIEIGHRNEGGHSERPVLSKPLPPNYRPIKFTRTTEVHLGDIEAVVDGFLVDLFGCDYLLEFRDFFGPLFPRMRIYEYVMQICRYAEGHLLANNEFLANMFAQWRRLLGNEGQSTLKPIVKLKKGIDEDGAKKSAFVLRGVDLEEAISTTSSAKARFGKVAEMLVQIAGLLHIPRLTDGVPLRYLLSYLYILLLDRLYLLEQFEACLGQLQLNLIQVNAQLAEAGLLGDVGDKEDEKSSRKLESESLPSFEQVTGDSLKEDE